jgi:DNA repair protein RecN (Recombination protein N)
MLCGIRIENFALVDKLELEFKSGLNVITGETGAGKSILLDAIDITLGGKANSRMIRTGSSKGMIEATFHTNPSLEEWLNQQEIELFEDSTVVCCRELTNLNGTFRSRCRVNGILVNRQLITQLRDRLLEITAQGQTVQLMLPTIQRDLLDLYGGKALLTQRQIVASAYEKSQKVKLILEKHRQSEQQRLQRLDLVKYQLEELESVQMKDSTELENLELERDRLNHIVELQQLSFQVYEKLYQNDREENSATDILGQGESILTEMVKYDPQLESILEMVRTALTQVVEAGHQIYGYGEGLEGDPQRLEDVEQRIRILKQICRKYGPNLTEAIAYYQKLAEELVQLTDSGQSLEKLEQEYLNCQENLTTACQKLTKLRKKAAAKLAQQLTEELKPLAMEKVLFECRFIPCLPNSYGTETIEYYFSPNPGEKLQPLSEIASGGEMSRFLLALKACLSQSNVNSKTLIFDEIDVGVSGKVAQAIAQKLNQLSRNNQLLCVTHQPLIAAMADVHYRVEKQLLINSENQEKLGDLRTVVRVKVLDNQNRRRDELAELSAGNSASEAIAFANSLLETAAIHKQKSQIVDSQ